MKLFNLFIFILSFIVGCFFGVRQETVKVFDDKPSFVVSKGLSTSVSYEKVSDNTPTPYIGCWAGMRGGKIKITNNRIYDLGAKQSSSYKLVLIKRADVYQDYLLKTDKEFTKSFLNKYIVIHYRDNGARGILSYDSHEDYLKDKFTGFGFFEEIDCKKFK